MTTTFGRQTGFWDYAYDTIEAVGRMLELSAREFYAAERERPELVDLGGEA